ncbi:MAG: hypothetical protein NT120_00770 [Candidatus Aenigmarchaeota archaeon]|nr:hypothetical protein [Candidatus Aenigmarchaeota archaeon]
MSDARYHTIVLSEPTEKRVALILGSTVQNSNRILRDCPDADEFGICPAWASPMEMYKNMGSTVVYIDMAFPNYESVVRRFEELARKTEGAKS